MTAFIAAVAGVQAALVGLAAGIASGYQALLMFDYYAEVTSRPPDLAQSTNSDGNGVLAPLRAASNSATSGFGTTRPTRGSSRAST